MQKQDLGKSRGGFTTKIHAACDALGNPLRFFITAGQRSDYLKALDLIAGFEIQALLADKGYDADYVIAAVGKGQAVILPRFMRKHQRLYDKALSKEPAAKVIQLKPVGRIVFSGIFSFFGYIIARKEHL